MSQNSHTHPSLRLRHGQPTPPSSLTALALGIGLMAPTTGQALVGPPFCSPLPYTVPNGSITQCGLDVISGGAAEVFVNANATSGYLQSFTFPTVSLLDSFGSKALLQLHAGDHVGAAIFATNLADSIGFAYGGDPAASWDQIGETGFAGIRIGTPGN